MYNFKDKIMKQKNTGRQWGRFALAGSQIGIFVSTLTLLMVVINAYAPVSAWFMERGIYLRFWVFMGGIVGLLMIAYVLAWKYLVVSFYNSSTEQFWLQNNPLIKKIENIEKIIGEELPEIKKKLEALEKK